MLVAIFPLILCEALLHVVLFFGTNNTITDGLSASNISRRKTGSKLVLVTRILYVTYVWAIKLSTSTFLHNLTISTASSNGRNQKILKWFYAFLFHYVYRNYCHSSWYVPSIFRVLAGYSRPGGATQKRTRAFGNNGTVERNIKSSFGLVSATSDFRKHIKWLAVSIQWHSSPSPQVARTLIFKKC